MNVTDAVVEKILGKQPSYKCGRCVECSGYELAYEECIDALKASLLSGVLVPAESIRTRLSQSDGAKMTQDYSEKYLERAMACKWDLGNEPPVGHPRNKDFIEADVQKIVKLCEEVAEPLENEIESLQAKVKELESRPTSVMSLDEIEQVMLDMPGEYMDDFCDEHFKDIAQAIHSAMLAKSTDKRKG